ncbi:MAG: DUF3990 domain-containing protein [Deltaproteobacteria bacterium]|nr:DUF3990 domain-containing protein [Deltaproteobacteria bacterium]
MRSKTLNRSKKGLPHKYGIVIGPAANDGVKPAIGFKLPCGAGPAGSDSATYELILVLLPEQLPAL